MNAPRRCLRLLLAGIFFWGVVSPAGAALRHDRIVVLQDDARLRKGADWFQTEVDRRTGKKLSITIAPVKILETDIVFSVKNHQAASPQGPLDGYQIQARATARTAITVTGFTARGTLCGIGRLLRELRLTPGQMALPKDLDVEDAPVHRIRGHQLGYRPKTNSYDAWDLDRWEQYYRDLLLFGINAVELIPPGTDDASTSPHFKRPPQEMLTEMSRLADAYDLNVWIWLPAMARDYSREESVARSLKEWAEVFEKTPRIDALFVPGGDPGGTPPKILFNLLEKQSENLKRFHPRAQIWVSPQGFRREEFDEFVQLVNEGKAPWMAGIVYGPQLRVSMRRMKELTPKMPIRHYPDITHSWRCEYPVPNWDGAWSLTSGREPINPRPVDHQIIFDSSIPYTDGFITYSEGCNDDVNKALWSAWGWKPGRDRREILEEYGRFFAGPAYENLVADIIEGLEKNWRGPVLENKAIARTLKQARQLEKHPEIKTNWRLQQLLYRAYYDAYVASRLRYETEWQEKAMRALAKARVQGSQKALEEAENCLKQSETNRPNLFFKQRATELSDDLFASIGMQLSVSRHQAIGLERGATLDGIDEPLNDRRWLRQQFSAIRSLASEEQKWAAIQALLNWEEPVPGALYDDLGNPRKQPHLVAGAPYELDPKFLHSFLVSFGMRNSRMSWWNHAESLFDQPLIMEYDTLKKETDYLLKITYAGDMQRRKIRLEADGFEIHPFQTKFFNGPVLYRLPRELTADGRLQLRWNLESGLGDNGRGCQVAEVWLMPNLTRTVTLPGAPVLKPLEQP